jgi:hypothetical protein
MSERLFATLLCGTAALVYAGNNSVEVTLETPAPQKEQSQSSVRRWNFGGKSQRQDSDSQFPQWEYKFKEGSDKAMGTAADVANRNYQRSPKVWPPAARS